ncbi:MAG: peptide ABC transporter substrate-binding protein [Ruminococcaceae bacterium]|nr:peptide ABC transporter substrate-binding protein [Oscillospiraceae bacterium]
MAVKRTSAWMLALAVIFVFLFGGCSSKGGKAFRFHIAAAPQNLDPQLSSDEPSLTVIGHIFSGLYRMDETGAPLPDFAASTEVSEDGLTYTFTLHQGSFWSYVEDNTHKQGEPVTADDFVFAFQRLFTPATKAPRANEYAFIKNAADALAGKIDPAEIGVTAPDPYTLVIQLERESPFFLQLLAEAPAMPCNRTIFTAAKGKYGFSRETTGYNGPFYISQWKNSSSLYLRKRATYYDAESILPASLTLVVRTEATDLPDQLSEGVADLGRMSGAEFSAWRENTLSHTAIEGSCYSLLFNCTDPVFQNKKIRQALAMAIDFEALKEQYPFYYQQATWISSPLIAVGGENYLESSTPPEAKYDPEQAFKLFQEGLAELKLSKLPKTIILCPESGSHAEILSYIQQQWQKNLLCFINMERTSDVALSLALSSREYSIAMIPLTTQTNSPASLLSRFCSSSTSITGYKSKTFDQAYAAGTSAKTATDAVAGFSKAESLLLSEAVCIPLYYELEYFVTAKDVEGISILPFGGRVDIRYADK